MSGHVTGLLMLYVASSILIGVVNVIVVLSRSSRRYRSINSRKGMWVLGAVIGLASIVILMPGSYVFTVMYLLGPSSKMRTRRGPRLPRPRQSFQQPCGAWNCKNGRVYENGTSTACIRCRGTGFEPGMLQ